MALVAFQRNPAPAPKLDHLRALEAESIHIMREVVAEFERPVMLYSIGKDSSVLLRLAQKAFYPGPIPFPLLHIDTTYKFREMIEFRDWYAREIGARLIVHTNQEAITDGTQPFLVGTQRCCGLLKTKSLLDGLEAGNFDAAFGGARRDEERSRAKERIFSLRDSKGQIGTEANQVAPGKRMLSSMSPTIVTRNGRVYLVTGSPGGRTIINTVLGVVLSVLEFETSARDAVDNIPIVPLYFAKEREVIVRGNSLIMKEQPFVPLLPGEKTQMIKCRMRSLGCSPCTGAIKSDADTVEKIIQELVVTKHSERQLRIIDHDQDGSMELKKREGYF